MSIWFKRCSTQNTSSISRPDLVYDIKDFLIDGMSVWSHGCLGGDECILCMGKLWIIEARGWSMGDCYQMEPNESYLPIIMISLWDPLSHGICFYQRGIGKCNASRGLMSISNWVVNSWNIAAFMWGSPVQLWKRERPCIEIHQVILDVLDEVRL